MSWEYFVLGVIAYQVLKMVWMTVETAVHERRQRRFLTFVQISFPQNKKITFVSVDATNKQSMQSLEQEIREHYNAPEELDRTLLVEP